MLFDEIEHLALQRLRSVNRLAGKRDLAKGVLAAFADRNRRVDPRPIV